MGTDKGLHKRIICREYNIVGECKSECDKMWIVWLKKKKIQTFTAYENINYLFSLYIQWNE